MGFPGPIKPGIAIYSSTKTTKKDTYGHGGLKIGDTKGVVPSLPL